MEPGRGQGVVVTDIIMLWMRWYRRLGSDNVTKRVESVPVAVWRRRVVMSGACVGRRVRVAIPIMAAHVTIVNENINRLPVRVRVIHAISHSWLRQRLAKGRVEAGGRWWVERQLVLLNSSVRHGIGDIATIVHTTTIALSVIGIAGRRLK